MLSSLTSPAEKGKLLFLFEKRAISLVASLVISYKMSIIPYLKVTRNAKRQDHITKRKKRDLKLDTKVSRQIFLNKYNTPSMFKKVAEKMEK